MVEAVAERGYAAAREATLRFDGVDVPEPRVPAEALTAALAGLDPAVRAALAESIRRARIVHEAQRRDDRRRPGRAGRHGHRAVDPGAPGRALRAGRPGRLPVQRGDERRARPGGRRGLDRGVLAGRRRSSAACRTRRILAACALLGVDEVYAVGGAQAIALAAYGDAALGIDAGRRDHRAGQRLRRRGQAAACAGWSASTPRPAPPRSRSWPTPAPTRCTSRPT